MKRKVKKRKNRPRRPRCFPNSEPKVLVNPTSINDLPDDLLVKILSYLPFKNAAVTCRFSKRWESLWKQVPKFVFCDFSRKKASPIISRFFQLNNAPVLETLHLKLSRDYAPQDYEKWLEAAVARHVRDLELLHDRFYSSPIPLPSILYTCQSLVSLRLKQAIIVDVPSTACFRLLKNLSLLHVSFSRDETVTRFLSACPNLETLIVSRWGYDNLTTFTIAVPLLQSLCVSYISPNSNHCGFVIDAPSLKTLVIKDNSSKISLVRNMPDLVKAVIMRKYGDSKFLGCLTSAKHVSLCLNVDGYLTSDFNQLVSLELCFGCFVDRFYLILKHTPKLRVLKFRLRYCSSFKDLKDGWEKPKCVPECLISSLETIEWVGYHGRVAEREVAIYILENANCLKTVAITRTKFTKLEEKLKLLIELKSICKCSSKFLL